MFTINSAYFKSFITIFFISIFNININCCCSCKKKQNASSSSEIQLIDKQKNNMPNIKNEIQNKHIEKLNINNEKIIDNTDKNNLNKSNNNDVKNENFNNKYNSQQLISHRLGEKFPWPPRVGLDNIGATCYMNATLQCLCQIEEFASYFKYDKHVNEVIDKYTKNKNNSLTASFKILVEKIWPDEAMNVKSDNRHFSPNEFKQKISKMNQLFQGAQANDAKDLVNFIIMTLHEELNHVDDVNNFAPQNNLIYSNQIEYLFQVFYQDYQRTFRSKISELFYAITKTHTKCLYCNDDQYNFQAYFFLVFPLEEVRKHAINNIYQNNMNQTNMNMNNFNMNNFNMMNPNFNHIQMNNIGMGFNPQVNNFNNMMNFNGNFGFNNNNAIAQMNNFQMMNQNMQFNNMNINPQNMIKLMNLNNNIVTIMDCFNYNQKIDKFTGSNQIYCKNCNQMTDANYCTYLTTAPKILILLLNRGTGIQFKVKLEFSQMLDISNYVSQNNGGVKYRLIGVITHLGENGQGGHFIAHCKSPIDNEWYTYNDAIVTKIEENEFQTKIINLGMPYLLFYKRIDN